MRLGGCPWTDLSRRHSRRHRRAATPAFPGSAVKSHSPGTNIATCVIRDRWVPTAVGLHRTGQNAARTRSSVLSSTSRHSRRVSRDPYDTLYSVESRCTLGHCDVESAPVGLVATSHQPSLRPARMDFSKARGPSRGLLSCRGQESPGTDSGRWVGKVGQVGLRLLMTNMHAKRTGMAARRWYAHRHTNANL